MRVEHAGRDVMWVEWYGMSSIIVTAEAGRLVFTVFRRQRTTETKIDLIKSILSLLCTGAALPYLSTRSQAFAHFWTPTHA
ncbi:hypothetical protein Y032_0030g2148 [Ancylostoma ceylanicum]|uniref:Uncharacterized protein n=1 Tax=Ancylostoma ceylanicum TaxID=53326 RepID=A0A016US10_9BILA|nr:hypothetical protein Y032_0030g2148 [Ancylostoma ceylanicum]